MRIAIVGTGYVADQYMSTLVHRDELDLVGVYDRIPERQRAFADFHGTRAYEDLESLLDDESIEMVLNLTNPRDHAAVTTASLEAGKHVYSEKPLGMTVDEAERLVELADSLGLRMATAPCNALGRTVQTIWKAISDGAIGTPRQVYAAFEAGYIAPHLEPWTWTSASGAKWPAKDEFEIGCTFEHAGYLLVPLLSMFGPVRRVTSFATTIVEDKGIPVDGMAPDLTIGMLEFADHDLMARVTCGISAPREKTFMVVGDEGVLTVESFRDDLATVFVQPHQSRGARKVIERGVEEARRGLSRVSPFLPWGASPIRLRRRYPFAIDAPPEVFDRRKRVDFTLGPIELAEAVRTGRPCRLDARVGVHVVELLHALQYPDDRRRDIRTDFERIAPLEWS